MPLPAWSTHSQYHCGNFSSFSNSQEIATPFFSLTFSVFLGFFTFFSFSGLLYLQKTTAQPAVQQGGTGGKFIPSAKLREMKEEAVLPNPGDFTGFMIEK